MSTPASTSVIAQLGANMTVQDMRTQLKARVEYAMAIESKYPDGPITNSQDEAEVKKLLEESDLLEARITAIEEKSSRVNRIQNMLDRVNEPQRPRMAGGSEEGKGRRLSPGEQFERSLEYQQRKQTGGFNSPLNNHAFGVQMEDGTSLLDWKTLLTGASATSGGPWVANDLQAGATQILQRELNILDLIPRMQTQSDTIEYVLESTYTNAAAFTAEATGTAVSGTYGTKPESALAFSTNTSPVRTLAHWLPVTNRMLADAPAIRGYINSRLLLGLTLALEAQVISGDGTGENLTGILNAGISSLARGTNNQTDALFIARTMVRTGGKLRPTAIVMNPVDFQAVRLLRENAATATLGQYLMGPPNTLGPTTVWGLPVVESENIAAGSVLVGAFDQGANIFDREQSAIRVGTVNDQFIRNIQTILAEQRMTMVVYRPTAFVKVTGY